VTVSESIPVTRRTQSTIEAFVTEWQMTSVPTDGVATRIRPRLLDFNANGETEWVAKTMDGADPSERINDRSVWDEVFAHDEF
jgi:hypothetical protein